MPDAARERAAYWRLPGLALEAMHADFRRHTYPMHAHDTYSFGVTDHGAQSFLCRGERRTSAAGLVMAFNPDDPHDGRAAAESGYRYRMLHLGEDLLRGVIADAAPGTAGLPLFGEPVVDDACLARALDRLYRAVVGHAPRLAVDERLTTAVLAMTGRAAVRRPRPAERTRGPADTAALERARRLLRDRFTEDVSADELAHAAGCSRFALYRGFRAAYGFAPSAYQRDLRLRHARALLLAGTAPSVAATEAGFTDQAHLTRWFARVYGTTPGAYVRAGAHSARSAASAGQGLRGANTRGGAGRGPITA
ncbi:AraC family transcriptional regulator [Streptomyces sp. NPDC049837]|uniref:AraC family transcriptional regulator n=1 Tax=Streptomyces sp. NPDC049837 TaxID=3155277 RepID=UPI003430BD13